MIVVKLGGSVSERVGRIIWELKSTGRDILIVPGGWIFADMVRKLETDDESAHWMAIAGMNIYGHYLSRYAAILEPENFDFDVRGVKVLLPYILLRKHDELPHSWDVTSDSIAVWIAEKIGAEDIIKVTDVDGIYINGTLVERISAEELTEETCLDRYSPKLLKEYGRDMFICNGLVEGRVKDYIMKGKAKGTKIVGR